MSPVSSAVDASAVARVVGIETIFSDLRGGNIVYLPQRIAVVGQGATSAVFTDTKRQVTSAFEVGTLYGFGSPLHLAVKQLLPTNGDGVGTIPVTVYPLEDAPAAVIATGDITPTGTATAAGTIKATVNNINSEAVAVAIGDTVADIVTALTAAINAVLDVPIIAVDGTTQVDITSKWKGASANDIYVEITGDTIAGVSFAVTQPVGGATNPDVDDSLIQIGNVWETLILNCFDIADTINLTRFAVVGESRWGALVRKPFVVFTGNTEAVVATAITVSDARKSDRTNVQLVAPGSNDLPFAVAARQLARIAVVANNNPPRDYGSQDATGLVSGTDGEQWTHTQRQQAVLGGSSTVEVKSSVVNISDVVTFYHPDGDPVPAYRYANDIVKLMQVYFNLDLIFATPDWDGAPLLPDDQATTNRSAKQPKAAVAAIAAMIDSLALEAIISNPAAAKNSIVAEISASNPKRLDVSFTIQLSGNANIISIDLNFGFYFG